MLRNRISSTGSTATQCRSKTLAQHHQRRPDHALLRRCRTLYRELLHGDLRIWRFAWECEFAHRFLFGRDVGRPSRFVYTERIDNAKWRDRIVFDAFGKWRISYVAFKRIMCIHSSDSNANVYSRTGEGIYVIHRLLVEISFSHHVKSICFLYNYLCHWWRETTWYSIHWSEFDL